MSYQMLQATTSTTSAPSYPFNDSMVDQSDASEAERWFAEHGEAESVQAEMMGDSALDDTDALSALI